MWHGPRFAYPDFSFKGCVFHWVHSVDRKLRELGLQFSYNNDEGTRSYCRRLFALPFLPAEMIQPQFQALNDEASSATLITLCDYVDHTWINSKMWKPARWSVFLQRVRANNDLEGWHHCLNRDAGRGQLQMYLLIELLNKEAEYVKLQSWLVQNDDPRRVERKEYRIINKCITAVWDEFTRGNITATQLLKKCGKIYGPVSKQDAATQDK